VSNRFTEKFPGSLSLFSVSGNGVSLFTIFENGGETVRKGGRGLGAARGSHPRSAITTCEARMACSHNCPKTSAVFTRSAFCGSLTNRPQAFRSFSKEQAQNNQRLRFQMLVRTFSFMTFPTTLRWHSKYAKPKVRTSAKLGISSAPSSNL